ncbi:MAG: hypothetical protein HZB26_15945 [Candidatus Hydrogenedentes bacterium]|nr:hypothetical protein [Candidatus Hydrogenedentota bacterium]
MTAQNISVQSRRVPIWVWGIIVVLSLLEPAQHLWLRYAPPEGAAPTGLHIPDDAIFLQSMRMFDNGYYSPYATCKAGSANSPGYFALPCLWFYGLLGSAGRAVGLDDFITLGIANVGYMVCEITGMTLWPGFEEYFRRYALYELLEGPYLSPLLYFPRVYYTLALALGFGGLTAHIRALRMACSQHLGFALLLYGAATLINMRVGVFVAMVAALYLLCRDGEPSQRIKHLLAVAASVGLTCWGVALMMGESAVMTANLKQIGTMAMWLSPFLSASIFILIPAAYRIGQGMAGLTILQRSVVFAAVGYLGIFLVLFGAYQVYYGNILICRDGAVAAAISDWALLGALAGFLAQFRFSRVQAPPDPHSWIVLWLVIFLAGSLSAVGHGWFLQFGPQRLMVLNGLPMSVLAAQGLNALGAARPRAARRFTRIVIGCGVTSTFVSATFFQGALGWGPGAPFAWAKPGLVTRADHLAMDRTPEGRILAPPLAADALALRNGHSVVFGKGSFTLTEQPYGMLEGGVERFFSKSANDAFRHQFAREWCVDHVYCSDTWRVDPAVIEQLRQASWLRVKYASGMAVVFEVLDKPKTNGARHGD